MGKRGQIRFNENNNLEDGDNKLTKVLMISAAVIGILIFGFVIFKFYGSYLQKSPIDVNGWAPVSLEGDSFTKFFPATYEGILPMAIYVQENLDSRKNIYLDIGNIEGNTSRVLIIDERRSFYFPEGKGPVLKIWAEEINSADYETYKTEVKSDFDKLENQFGYERKNSNYNGVEYDMYRRAGVYIENLEGASSIGSAYVFFPDKNIITFILFLNTKLLNCIDGKGECQYSEEEKILSFDEMKNVVQQLIDSVNSD